MLAADVPEFETENLKERNGVPSFTVAHCAVVAVI